MRKVYLMDTIPTTKCEGCGLRIETFVRHDCYGRNALNEVTVLMDGKPTIFRRLRAAWNDNLGRGN